MNNALVKNDMSRALAVPTGSLDAYIQAANEFPMLTAEQEIDYATRLQRDNDLEAARQLVLSHLRFVIRVARGYSGYGLPMGDLVQEGNIGLMKAVKRFDPTQGVRLVSFAVHWVRAEIHEYILRNWRIVKVATTKAQRKLFFNLRSAKKRLGWLNKEEVDAVANDLGVTPKDVMEMESRLSGLDMAFDGHQDQDNDDETAFLPAAYLEDHRDDPALTLADSDQRSHDEDRLAHAMSELDERSQDILRRRWLDEGKATLHELADKYGVSAERIRQLEQNALKKLKTSLAA